MHLLRVWALAAVLVVPRAVLRQPEPELQWGASMLTSNAGELIAADTTSISLPERTDRPAGARVRLPVMRLRSSSATPGAPLVFVAGGPGESGLVTARGELFPYLAALRQIGDVILYDQRGTGLASPRLTVDEQMNLPLDESIVSDASRQRLVHVARAAAQRIAVAGIDLSSYTTEQSVEDLEAIRRALRINQWTLWGHSYGSHLVLAYLRRFEGHTSRVILGGTNGPDQRRRLPHDADVTLGRIDSAARATPRLRVVMPDLLGTIRRVLGRLERAPATVSLDGERVVVGKHDVQLLIAVMGGDRTFVQQLPQMIGDMDAGQFENVARQLRSVLKRRPVGTAMTFAMDLASGVSASRAALIDTQRRDALLGNAINYPFDDPAFVEAWGISPLPESFRQPVRSAVPAQFISGSFDLRTSTGDTELVRHGFVSSGHIVVAGASHMPYGQSPALLRRLISFAGGAAPLSETLPIELELRGPDEASLVASLRSVAESQGADSAVSRMKALASDSTHHLTSFVPGNLFFALRQRGRTREAAAVLNAGSALFPRSTFLLLRRAEMATARGDSVSMMTLYREVLSIDPLQPVARARVPSDR
jgi:pimeloyl-ACP methyl ester carboxylesterase